MIPKKNNNMERRIIRQLIEPVLGKTMQKKSNPYQITLQPVEMSERRVSLQ